jgi:hypothetical protein
MNSEQILERDDNAKVLLDFFKNVASGEYGDGRCYRLYYDINGNSIFDHVEASSNSWLNWDGLHELHREEGYWNGREEDRYDDEVHYIDDFGWQDWYYMIESQLESILQSIEQHDHD